jgi:hypothetical protein
VGRLLLGVLVAAASLSIAWGDLEGQTAPPPDPAGAVPDATNVPGQYIVVFHDEAPDPLAIANQIAVKHGGNLRYMYEHALKGCAITLTPQAVEILRANPNVAYVEPDRYVQVFGTQTNPPNWGLDRIDQADLPLNNTYNYGNDGSGLNVYIIDSGVRATHSDFGGRVQFVPNGNNGDFVGDGQDSAEDCFGHGTHVAGILAGSAHGVAKDATIWALRVLDCSGNGTASMALAAVDWITANGQLPAVVNVSLGYLMSQALTDAVENSVAAGFTYVVAAGNQIVPADACMLSPGNAPHAITVGATEVDEDESYFSNYGTCVDILAPGSEVLSTGYTDDNATQIQSGTSQAAPHVAGAAALFLTDNPGATPAEVSAALVAAATPGRINLHSFSETGGTPNLLLNVSSIGDPGVPPTNNSPTIANAIPDTTVAENSPPINGYNDLNDVFTDIEDGDSLSFSVISVSDTSLVGVTIDQADSTLDLTIKPSSLGTATIVVRALDSDLATVQDTFVVSVVDGNIPPSVASAMPDTTVFENSPPVDNYRDLNDVFTDPEDGGALQFVIHSNSNSGLVSATIDADSALDLSFTAAQTGMATIVVRATDAGTLTVDDTVIVNVTPFNTRPIVTSAIPDTTVGEDSAPAADYRDLNDVFADVEDGSALSFTIQSNSNPALVTPTIDPSDSTLDMSFAADANGSATLVIRATDSGALSVTDTVLVTVTPVNDAPVVAVAIADTTMSEDDSPVTGYRDLNDVFSDVEDGNALTFAIQSNSDPALVMPTIDLSDSTLGFSFGADLNGAATLVIRATDSGTLWVDETVVVTVTAVNDAPIVASAIADTTVTEDDPPVDNYRDLNDVFSDVEDSGALGFVIHSNSNPSLLIATIDADSALDLSFVAGQNGVATLVVRATDSGVLSVDDTVVVTVALESDPPVVVSAVPDTTVIEDSAPVFAYRDLNDVFSDTEDGNALSFAVVGNSYPALVTATVDSSDSTLDLSFGADLSGTAAMVIRATDSGGLWADDLVFVTVTPVNDAPVVVSVCSRMWRTLWRLRSRATVTRVL